MDTPPVGQSFFRFGYRGETSIFHSIYKPLFVLSIFIAFDFVTICSVLSLDISNDNVARIGQVDAAGNMMAGGEVAAEEQSSNMCGCVLGSTVDARKVWDCLKGNGRCERFGKLTFSKCIAGGTGDCYKAMAGGKCPFDLEPNKYHPIYVKNSPQCK